MGNGEAKEVICMFHGHELKRGGGMMVRGGYRVEGKIGKKKWDNHNSIINTIYFLKKKKKKAINQRPPIIWLHICKMSRTGKPMEK